MKILFLGSGSSLNVSNKNYHSNLLLTSDSQKNLLIDCGTDIRFSLMEQGFSASDISAIYVSHIHADHAGGLEWMGFSTKFDYKTVKPNLFISNQLVKSLWENSLSGGMDCIENENASLRSYFDVHSISNNNVFAWEDINFKLIPTHHVKRNKNYLPCFGLMISYKKKSIFFTSDTIFDASYFHQFYEIADLIFHDCELKSSKSGVHAHYDELKKLPATIKNKMWLYHYQDVNLPPATNDEFLGFIDKGQSFYF